MLPVSPALLRHLRALNSATCLRCSRVFSTAGQLSSGHSKWATIKHDKARNDTKKHKARTLLARDIANATRFHGSDPTRNNQLANLISNAKKTGMTKGSIDAAILRGQGKSSTGAALESMTIEAVVPPVALMVDFETDNKPKALQDLRLLLKTHGGRDTPTAYLFEKRGRITFVAKDGVGADDVLEAALESGALDIDEAEEGTIVVDTEPSALKAVEAALVESLQLEVSSSEHLWHPNSDTIVQDMEDEALGVLLKLTDELEEYPGVQGVYTNLDPRA